jgi:glucokinase
VSFAQGVVLGVVVEPGRLAAGLVDGAGEVLVRDRVAMPQRDVWGTLDALIGRVMAAAPGDAPRPHAAGVACVGPVDVDAGAVSPHLIGQWRSFPLAEEVAAVTGLRVHLDSVASAHVEAVLRSRGADDPDSFITLLIDQTVESSTAVDGHRLRGAHGNAGSLAHLTVEPDGPVCWCGAQGCLAAYAGGAALEEEIGRSLRRASPSVVERTGLMIGRALASALSIFDVPTVYLGGFVVDIFGGEMVDVARRELAERSRLSHLEDVVIRPAPSVPGLVAAASLTQVPSRV